MSTTGLQLKKANGDLISPKVNSSDITWDANVNIGSNILQSADAQGNPINLMQVVTHPEDGIPAIVLGNPNTYIWCDADLYLEDLMQENDHNFGCANIHGKSIGCYSLDATSSDLGTGITTDKIKGVANTGGSPNIDFQKSNLENIENIDCKSITGTSNNTIYATDLKLRDLSHITTKTLDIQGDTLWFGSTILNTLKSFDVPSTDMSQYIDSDWILKVRGTHYVDPNGDAVNLSSSITCSAFMISPMLLCLQFKVYHQADAGSEDPTSAEWNPSANCTFSISHRHYGEMYYECNYNAKCIYYTPSFTLDGIYNYSTTATGFNFTSSRYSDIRSNTMTTYLTYIYALSSSSFSFE